ncbi:MAG: hypothetical protein SYNGOMJ08_00288 [Candidatus Syntrophoarchaeum sp. GoM_oil]|nr:MAG: hypothetical protein SYNGOMJ08_00288 [Candidatus Syntrophoarchaeum sp. GoM_oil]
MYLEKDEERILDGENGETLQKSMEILVTLGKIYGANRLIPIESAQIAGVSYKTIGDAGIEWIEDIDAKVVVPAILNPMGMDREIWQEMGITDAFYTKQIRILDAYSKMGIKIECTCTPYYLEGGAPKLGDHLAWSESSAVSFANSVLGAKTNREGGISALASALIGKTPLYGYHLDKNRVPVITIRVPFPVSGSDFGALGYVMGKTIGDRVAIFELEATRKPSNDELKSLGAALAATGAVALYHVKGVTPEADQFEIPEEVVVVEEREIAEVYERAGSCTPDLIAVGCPHLSINKLELTAELLGGKKVKREFWLCVSRDIKERRQDLVETIESSGAKVISDTCMVVSPACERFDCIMTDSGKALNYIPSMCRTKAVFGSFERCIEVALGEDRKH